MRRTGRMGKVSCVAAAAFAWPAAAPALADSVAPAPASAPFGLLQEVRVGGFYDDPRPRESPSAVGSIEGLSAPVMFYGGGNPFFAAFLNPRLNLGAMVSLRGGTSYVFSGVNWRAPVFAGLFAELEFGGALNDSASHIEPGRLDLGCPVTFRESGGVGYQITANFDVIASVEHVSHASLCGRNNPGLTSYGLRVGYHF